MKKFAISICLMSVSLLMLAQKPSISVDGDGMRTEVTVYDNSIVRVVKYPATLKQAPEKHSFSVILTPQKCETTVNGNSLETASMKVTVDSQGRVTFATKDGKTLLKEQGGRVAPITSGVDKGFYTSSQAFSLDKDEAIFGLGQRKDFDMNQRGKDVTIWSTNTNITIPYITSEKGYGLYWDNAGRSFFKDNSERTEFSSEVGSGIDYYFLYKDGTQDGVMASVRELTGQATMFPLWTMGF